MIVQRPNRLRAEITSDKQQRLYFYDGKSLSIWARRLNYYTTVPAPPTIRELVDTLTSRYDIELPLVDLFYWSDRNSTGDITSAVDLGPSQVEGVTRTGRSGFSSATIRSRASWSSGPRAMMPDLDMRR
jgi:hypothetical protein